MGKVLWKRKEAIKNAYSLIPPVLKASGRDFRPPPTILSDFERLLQHDVPNVNFTFEILHDWYDQYEEGYVPYYVRGQQTPIDWKSKIGNSDMSTNFKVDHKAIVYKGDLAIREDGTIYMLSWNVYDHANNQATQALECNAEIEFTRMFDDIVDSRGYLIEKGGRRVVVPSIPCNHTEYAGRPDYSATEGMPGLSPDHLITVTLQWNSTTRKLHIDDEFVIGDFTYRIINISIAEVNITKEHGVLSLNAKRVAGGGLQNAEL